MPVTPYSGQVYSLHTTERLCTAGFSNYSSAYPSGYRILGSNSTTTWTPKYSDKPHFLSGNTSNLKKAFTNQEGVDDASTQSAYGKKLGENSGYRTASPQKFLNNNGCGSLDKTNQSMSAANSDTASEQDNLPISRNRQVIRLTIKREKVDDKKGMGYPENSVKTIAQKLFEKYTIPEKREKESIPVHRNRITAKNIELSDQPKIEKSPKPQIRKISIPKDTLKPENLILPSKVLIQNDENDGDDELSDDDIDFVKKDKDVAAKCLVRATEVATSKRDLVNQQEVKDAIVAAILHPGIDIESDEEIKRLVDSGSDKSRSVSKKQKLSSEAPDLKLLERRKKSEADIEGDMIIDKLKKYVKTHASNGTENNADHHKNDIPNNDTQLSEDKRKINNEVSNSEYFDISQIDIKKSISSPNEVNMNEAAINKEDKTTTINKELISKTSQDTKGVNNENDFDKSISNKSLHPDEIKISSKESLCKSFEPVYQSSQVGDSRALIETFQDSYQLSRDVSITHPENKLPEIPSFIIESLPDKNEVTKISLPNTMRSNNKNNPNKGEGRKVALEMPCKNKQDMKNNCEKLHGDDIAAEIKQTQSKNIFKNKLLDNKTNNEQILVDLEERSTNELEKSNFQLKENFGEKKSENKEKLLMSPNEDKEIKKTSLESQFNSEEMQGHQCSDFMDKAIPINPNSEIIILWKGEKEDKFSTAVENTVSPSLNLAKSKGNLLKSLALKKSMEDGVPGTNVNNKKDNTIKEIRLNKDNSIYNKELEIGKINKNLPEDAEEVDIKPSLKWFLREAMTTMQEGTKNKSNIQNSNINIINETPRKEKVTKVINSKKENNLNISIKKKSFDSKKVLNEKVIFDQTPKTKEKIETPNGNDKLSLANKIKNVGENLTLAPNENHSKTENERLINDHKEQLISKTKEAANATENISKTKCEIESKEENFSIDHSQNKICQKSKNPENKCTTDIDNCITTKNLELKKEIKIDTIEKPRENNNDDPLNLKLTLCKNTKSPKNKPSPTTNELSNSISADSAYGSSPSSPQPKGAVNLKLKKSPRKTSDKRQNVIIKTTEVEVESDILCTLCGTNCHKKCEKQMPNLCGVNQKLLAEALCSVKKGGSIDGKDTSRLMALASASASASKSVSSESDATATTDEDTETETESSSDYDGPTEIRSPIQTTPKFRKYMVEDFNFIKVLGKGSFGKVMLAQQVNTENYFAVKCLKKDVVLEDNDVECCLIERKVLTLATKHPYLCHLFCSFQTPSHLFFVMEYLTGGDLMFHIQRTGRFDEYRTCFYAAEIISGLKYLHNKGIIYRDLKLDNILLDYEGHIRIADFGMCKLQIYLDRYADTFCGTPDYMAPEVIKGLQYNQCVDWWSLGVLLYEMMIGKSPFKGCDEDHLFWLICNEEPFYPRFLTREAMTLLKQLLEKDSTKRLGPPYSTYGEIKYHAFFKYIDWDKIDHKQMETPYKPRLRHILDVQYFDRSFTKRNAALTPLEESILESMDQTPFKEFSYTNPNITD